MSTSNEGSAPQAESAAGVETRLDALIQPAAQQPPASERWGRMVDSLHQLLTGEKEAGSWVPRLDELARSLAAFVTEDPDRAVYLALRPTGRAGYDRYSALHGMQCAVVCQIIAGRLSWAEAQARSLVHAALTMNIAMTELQAVLATQKSGLRPEQRAAIRSHPAEGAAILRRAGVVDELWLQVVEQHHQRSDGSGYPGTALPVSPLADALRKVDELTAKLSARASRPPLSSHAAARSIFSSNAKDPVVAAIIKELGMYMPGILVRLASGHTAVVVRRGEKVHTPMVACLIDRNGSNLPAPQFCDTADKRFAIVGEANITVRIDDDEIFARLDGASAATAEAPPGP